MGQPTEDVHDSDDEFVRKLKETVKKVKADREMGARYMTLEDLLKEERQEGRAEGEIFKLVEQIKKKWEKQQSIEQIAEALEESVETIERLMKEYIDL